MNPSPIDLNLANGIFYDKIKNIIAFKKKKKKKDETG